MNQYQKMQKPGKHPVLSWSKLYFVTFHFFFALSLASVSPATRSAHADSQCTISDPLTALWDAGPEGAASQSSQISAKVLQSWIESHGVAEFCAENIKYDLAGLFFNLSPKEFDQELKLARKDPGRLKTFPSIYNSWANSMYPSETLKLFGFEHNDYLSRVNIVSRSELKAILRNKDAKIQPPSSLRTFEGMMEGHDDQKQDIAQAHLAVPVLCSFYGIRDAHDCMKSMKRILDLMSPHNGYVLVEVTKEVLSQPKYVEGAKKAALKILEKVEAGGVPKGDLYSDILDSYLESGLNRKDAENCAWNLLGVMATEGPNTSGGLYPIELGPGSSAVKVAMAVISSAAPVLESRSAKTGHSYSYPKGVKTTCDYGKFYHFWMSAFLARKMTQEFGNPKAAISASWLAEQGYQMRSTTVGRNPARAFQVPAFDPINNKMRIDLAFGAAGSVYGAFQAVGKDTQLNIDQALMQLIQDAKPQSELTPEAAEAQWKGTGSSGYFRWKKIFSPDSALDFYLQNQKQ